MIWQEVLEGKDTGYTCRKASADETAVGKKRYMQGLIGKKRYVKGLSGKKIYVKSLSGKK